MFALRAFVVLMLTFAVAPVLLCQEQGPSNRSDAEITARVKAALIDEQTEALINQEPPTEAHIRVETNDGVVRLSGFVASADDKDAAKQAAASVKGVVDVRNEWLVRQEDRAVRAVVEDSVIEARVKAELAGDTALGTAVTVKVSGGVVQLGGFVESAAQKTRATTIASTINGVEHVRNEIAVQSR